MERVRGLKERVHIQLEGGMIVRRDVKENKVSKSSNNICVAVGRHNQPVEKNVFLEVY